MTDIVEPKFLVHQATHLFLTDPIFFQVTQMNQSLFVWIGKADGKMGDMSVAVPAFASQVNHLNFFFFSPHIHYIHIYIRLQLLPQQLWEPMYLKRVKI